jgi:hypothetical protein
MGDYEDKKKKNTTSLTNITSHEGRLGVKKQRWASSHVGQQKHPVQSKNIRKILCLLLIG